MTNAMLTNAMRTLSPVLALYVGALLVHGPITYGSISNLDGISADYLNVSVTPSGVTSSWIGTGGYSPADIEISKGLSHVAQTMQMSTVDMDADLLNDVHSNIWSLL